jgi:hypothetical protein
MRLQGRWLQLVRNHCFLLLLLTVVSLISPQANSPPDVVFLASGYGIVEEPKIGHFNVDEVRRAENRPIIECGQLWAGI